MQQPGVLTPSTKGARGRRICTPSGRCRPSRQLCCRAYSARGLFRWVLTERVRPTHAHIRLLSVRGAPDMGCTSRSAALVDGLCARGRFALIPQHQLPMHLSSPPV